MGMSTAQGPSCHRVTAPRQALPPRPAGRQEAPPAKGRGDSVRNPNLTEESSKRSDLRGPLRTPNEKELETFPGAARHTAQAMFDCRPHVAD